MSRDQTTPYSVSVEGDRTLQAIVGAVLSSLPRTYSRLEGAVRAPVDVVAVAGGGEWADAAVQAIDAGVRGVIVIEPSPVALPGVDRLAEKAGAQRAVVRLARRWAGDPAVVPFSRARAVGGERLSWTVASNFPVECDRVRRRSPRSTWCRPR